MSSISSITKAVSGLAAAQKGLQVTGHNLSNVNTEGYTRQQLLQSESDYLVIGNRGSRYLQVGLGVTQDEIRQIRNELADKRLRTENSVLTYYQTQNSTIAEIEAILDEPYGEGVTKLLNNFWSQTQKLNTTPNGVEERQSFISAANVLIKKINDISDSLDKFQANTNKEVISSVNRINQIIEGIKEYNDIISRAEVNGDNANDYRDQRNNLLDELSEYGKVTYHEEVGSKVVVKFENHLVVDGPFTATMNLEEAEAKSVFVKPVWSDTNSDVYRFDETVTSVKGNDTGKLKALLISRGNNYVTEDTKWEDIAFNDNFSVDEPGNSFIIPKIQKMLSDFTGVLVETVNSCFDGTGIGTHEGKAGVPVFVPILSTQEYEAAKKNLETVLNDPASTEDQKETAQQAYEKAANKAMTTGNIQVNPELLANGGYNKLGTVSTEGASNNVGDSSKVTEFLSEWGKTREWYSDRSEKGAPNYKKVSITSFYSEFVTDIGTDGSNYSAVAKSRQTSILNIQNERQAMGGVSQDEEFANMLKYQYAYNASARMITMLDGMLDTIINKM